MTGQFIVTPTPRGNMHRLNPRQFKKACERARQVLIKAGFPESEFYLSLPRHAVRHARSACPIWHCRTYADGAVWLLAEFYNWRTGRLGTRWFELLRWARSPALRWRMDLLREVAP